MYNPDQELSKEELDVLAKEDFNAFLDYLDSKANYLKKFSIPLSSYHKKRYAAMSEALAKEERDRARQVESLKSKQT